MLVIWMIIWVTVFCTICLLLTLAAEKIICGKQLITNKHVEYTSVYTGDYIAKVLCGGTDELAKKKYIYNGISDCRTAVRIGGGDKLCSHGCLGLRTCAAVCPSDAIIIINGIAAVDRTKCIGCGKCVEVCPKKTIKLIPRSVRNWIGCISSDGGNTEHCQVGCIGCGNCRDICDSGAIVFDGNTMTIDCMKCGGCGKCAEICDRKVIWTA